MAFNHRFPDPIAPLDTNGLLKAISDPQAASALWAKYEQVRKDYESLRASIAAEHDDLIATDVAVAESKRKLEEKQAEFNKLWIAFEKEQFSWDAEKAKALSLFAQKEAEFQAKNAEVLGRLSAAATAEANAVRLNSDFEKYESSRTKDFLTWEADMKEREAAVAKREEKANQLAALLKEV